MLTVHQADSQAEIHPIYQIRNVLNKKSDPGIPTSPEKNNQTVLLCGGPGGGFGGPGGGFRGFCWY